MSAGQMLRQVRMLLARRQPALGYLVAIAAVGTALDLADSAVRHQFHSFSSFSRLEFDNVVQWRAVASLRDAPLSAIVLVGLSVPLAALVTAWLRSCYLVALDEGRYSLRAPRRTVGRLTLYFLAFQIIWIALFGLADNGRGGYALLVQLVLTPATLYSDFSIVLDDVGPVDGVRRSLRICRQRPRESVAVVLALLLIVALTLVAFSNGFTDSDHVQPSYLVAWLLVGVLTGFLGDVVLLTLFRATPPPDAGAISAAAPAGPPEGPRPPEASD
jgi:hypothetical protein